MRVSEKVTIEEIESWIAGWLITIKAGTGAGKSYFIKNVLYALAKREKKKILMLIHRTNCTTQFKKEIIRDKKTDVIDIMTYQKLEVMYLKAPQKIDLSEYQYIVCDEFHYFMGDAAFSKTTDISLSIILNQKSAIKIFMSATGDDMKDYLKFHEKLEIIPYDLPITYDFIENLSFFHSDETYEKFIEEAIEKNHKAIFFIQSSTKGYELYKKYKKHCLFNCGKSDKHYKYVDKKKIDNMLEKERFEELILITTTCLDAGVNIIDLELKHIVCEVEDTGTLIQCIGRKRIQHKDDKFYLYIKVISNKSFGIKVARLNKKLAMAQYLRKHTVKEFLEEYRREYDLGVMVYDQTVTEENRGTKKINWLMFFKCKIDLREIKKIIKYGKYGYCEYIKNLFGRENYRVIEEDYKTNDLVYYLNGIVGKRLLKEGQIELIENIDIKDKRGRIQKSISIFNAYFDENQFHFIIKSETDNIKKLEDGSKNPYYRKVYWIIYKLSDTENVELVSKGEVHDFCIP